MIHHTNVVQSDVEAGVSPAWLEECGRHGRHYTKAWNSFAIALSLLLFALLSDASAQESPTPTASPSPTATRTVRISFVPPPLEGTISLGIYDLSGKLLRVLHRESETEDFTIGHDALITEWDGKNDAGQDLPAGKYNARGYMVGALAIEGIDYFFNDWVVDENSPRVRHVWNVRLEDNELQVNVDLAGGNDNKATLICDPLRGGVLRTLPMEIVLKCDQLPPLPNIISYLDCDDGKEGSLWVIDTLGEHSGREVKQLSRSRELLRRLTIAPDDPRPSSIAASKTNDQIFLIEQTEGLSINRLRALTLAGTKNENGQSISDWKVDFEKKIVAHKDFSLENGTPVATGGKPTPDKITLQLQPNPLKRDKPGSVEVGAGFDQDGSYLKTSDGLPLRTISDTPNLSRALLTLHGEKAIDVFQDDGAVVEQFRISGADQMMAFDCGSFELK